MNLLIQIFILVVFFKTGNLLSENNLFSVNNILLEKKDDITNKQLTNKAISEAFDKLINRILLKEDVQNFSSLDILKKKELVSYYNISKNSEGEKDKINFNVTFDREKMHSLFYQKGVSYSDIADKDLFILPIFIIKNEVFIFSNNFFYNNWNKSDKLELIEFALPLENIEIIQEINKSKNNLLNLELDLLFREYLNENKALVLIEEINTKQAKVYLKTKIQTKEISKNLNINIRNDNLNKIQFYEKIIFEIKKEMTNLIKSQNLVNIGTPSFLNVRLNIDEKNNLFSFNSKIKNIDLIDTVLVQEFNKDHIFLRIKYLGNLDKIMNQLNKENVKLKLIQGQWFVDIL